MKPAVYITQLLCPLRHCILANAFVYRSEEDVKDIEEKVLLLFKTAVDGNLLNSWCGLCGSPDLHVETGRTAFTTMEEAVPHLKAAEEAQLKAVAMLKKAQDN